LRPTCVGKVGKISPWIQKKKIEVANMLHVVGNEMQVAILKLNNVNKYKEHLCTKMEHVKVVHESMTSMMEEKEEKLNVLQYSGVRDGGGFSL
jgi:hypothetical protein